VPVFDADAEVHRLQGPGGRARCRRSSRAFPGTTGESGVDRALLGKAVFGNPDALKRLELIVHPAVAHERGLFLESNRTQPLVVLDIPLLFEAGGWQQVDKIAVVSAPAQVQRARDAPARHDRGQASRRFVAKQVPDAVKRERADFVIETGRTPNATTRRKFALHRLLPSGRG
jgi:dephospho-CoA kinase